MGDVRSERSQLRREGKGRYAIMRFGYRIAIIDALTRSAFFQAVRRNLALNKLFTSLNPAYNCAGLTADWLRPNLFPTLIPEIPNSLTAQ
jgi:hypothetical protein